MFSVVELIYSCRSLQDETILNTVEGLEKGIKMIYASVASNPGNYSELKILMFMI